MLAISSGASDNSFARFFKLCIVCFMPPKFPIFFNPSIACPISGRVSIASVIFSGISFMDSSISGKFVISIILDKLSIVSGKFFKDSIFVGRSFKSFKVFSNSFISGISNTLRGNSCFIWPNSPETSCIVADVCSEIIFDKSSNPGLGLRARAKVFCFFSAFWFCSNVFNPNSSKISCSNSSNLCFKLPCFFPLSISLSIANVPFSNLVIFSSNLAILFSISAVVFCFVHFHSSSSHSSSHFFCHHCHGWFFSSSNFVFD